MKKVLIAALAFTWAVFCSPSIASPVTWQFTGKIDYGNGTGFFFPFVVAPGDSVIIDLALEPDTPCSTCGSTFDEYQNPLTALSFTVNGKTFDFPLTSSDLILAKDEPAPPQGHGFLNLFDLFYQGFDSSSAIAYQGALALQSDTSTPPVPGINDVHLANLLPPDPTVFVGAFPPADTNFFDVGASQDRGFNSFAGHTLTSAAVSVPEPSTLPMWAAGLTLVVLLGIPRTRVRHRRG